MAIRVFRQDPEPDPDPWPPPVPELQVLDPAGRDRALDLLRDALADPGSDARTVARMTAALTARPGDARDPLTAPAPPPPAPGPAGPCETAAATARRPAPGAVSWWPQ